MKKLFLVFLFFFGFQILFSQVNIANSFDDYYYKELEEFIRLFRLILVITPPEIRSLIEPVLDDIIREVLKIVKQNPANFSLPRSIRREFSHQPSPGDYSTIPSTPQPSRNKPIGRPMRIGVIDVFGDPNGLDNSKSHGELVVGTIRDSMSQAGEVEGKDYQIVKINLADYRIRTGSKPIYTKNGDVIIDGVIYRDYRNLSLDRQHNYRAIGVVISAYGLIQALEDARNYYHVNVINMSNGINSGGGNALREEFERLRDAGIIVVAAAGNEGRYGATYPARYSEEFDNVIGVGTNAYYSNYGSGVTLNADGNYKGYRGTSFAAPRVTAAVALLLSEGISSYNVKETLLSLSRECTGDYYLPEDLGVLMALLNASEHFLMGKPRSKSGYSPLSPALSGIRSIGF